MLTRDAQTPRVLEVTDDRLYRAIAGVLGVPPDSLEETSSPETLPAWDSLNHLNIVMALESEFGISLGVDDVIEMNSVAAIRAVLDKYGVKAEVSAVHFVDLRPEQLPGLQEFFARMYRPDYILAVNADYFRWQFGDTPVSKRQDLHMRLALDGDQIIGCLGYIPLEFTVGDGVITGAWLANWMVDPNARQAGLGPLLVRDISRDFEFTLAAGPNKSARDLLGRMGWTDFGELPRYVAVLDPTESGKLTESGTLAWPQDVLSAAAGNPSDHVQPVERYSDEATALWDRVAGAATAGTRRTAGFLNWRYVEHAVFKYRLFEARRGGELAGFAVYRVEQVRDMPVKVGRIVEFVAEPDVEDALLDGLLADAESQGCAALDLFCSSSKLAGVMTRHGFLPGDDPAARQIPVLFQPIDRRRSGVVVMADLKNVPGAAGVADWYFTKADGTRTDQTKF